MSEGTTTGTGDADRWTRGEAKMREVYAGDIFPLERGTMAFYDVMLESLFATVWDRPQLSVRERRLLIMGVIAANGSVDTWNIQARAALENEELTPDQLRECLIQLAPYAGYPNVAAFTTETEKVIHQWGTERAEADTAGDDG